MLFSRVVIMDIGTVTANITIMTGEIDIIINTPDNKQGLEDDSYIRKSAIRKRVFYVTTVAAAKATVEGIKAVRSRGANTVKSLQKFHSEIE